MLGQAEVRMADTGCFSADKLNACQQSVVELGAAGPKAALGLGVAAALAALFAACLNPPLVVDLANRIWAC